MIHSADTTIDQLEQFRSFVLDRIGRGGSVLSIDDLYDEWRIHNPSPSELEADSKAIAASLQDLDRGERGKPIDSFLQDFKKTHGIE